MLWRVEEESDWSRAFFFFFFTKVKKSLARWELWFVFVVVQVEVKLERMDHFDLIQGPGYTRSSTSPPINIHILNAPWLPLSQK